MIKNLLKKIPFLLAIKRSIHSYLFTSTRVNILKEFSGFIPYSSGSYRNKSDITINTINTIFPRLNNIPSRSFGNDISIDDIKSITKNKKTLASALKLKKNFDFYGSDKSNNHNYHYLYGSILTKKKFCN